MNDNFQIKKFICYGAGDAFHWVEEVLEKRMGGQILAIIDRKYDQISKDFLCPVWNSDTIIELVEIAKINKNIPVILALGDPKSCQAVCSFLNKIGFDNVITLNQIYHSHLGFQLDDVDCEQLQLQLKVESEIISQSREILSDETSQKVFDQLLSIYKKQQGTWIDCVAGSECHFPFELHNYIDYSCVVQCGVATDEIQILLGQKIHPIQELIGFEPDPIIYEGYDLVPGINAHVFERSEKNINTKIAFHQVALHSFSGHEVFFSAGSMKHDGVRKVQRKTGFGSRLLSYGTNLVMTTNLDTALYGNHPTFIAIDAEGAELDIIEGAFTTIEVFRPALMIAIYHKMSHLWQVINLLNQRYSGYHFYIRNYTGFSYETFLYAIPEERFEEN